MHTPSFDVKILVEKVRIIGGYLRYAFRCVDTAVFASSFLGCEKAKRRPWGLAFVLCKEGQRSKEHSGWSGLGFCGFADFAISISSVISR